MVLNGRAEFDLAVGTRECGAPIGEVFSFVSGWLRADAAGHVVSGGAIHGAE